MEGYGNENPGAFQPTRPLRGATGGGTPSAVIVSISTHAPLAGRDEANATYREANFGISTHAPLAGRDYILPDASQPYRISTHAPLAGRDWVRRSRRWLQRYFNPRAPCGARRVLSFEGGA